MARPEPIKCKAAVAWKANTELVLEDIIVDAPHAGEVRIRILATSLCHTDLSFLTMEQVQFPRILGHEGAGIVESVGEGVEDIKVGDHVLPVYTAECGVCGPCKSHYNNNLCEKYFPFLRTTFMLHPIEQKSRFSVVKEGVSQPILSFMTSTFTEYTVLHADCVAKLSPNTPLDQACLFGCGVPTGLGAVWNTAKVEKGDTVAIFGLGTIGLAVADGARVSGASRIIGIDLNPEKFKIAKKFGVTECINPNDYKSPIHEVLQEITDGGVNYAFECVGKVQLMESALESTREGHGMAVLIGMDTSMKPLTTMPLTLYGRSIAGSVFGGFKGKSQIPQLVDRAVRKEVMASEYITHTLPFKDINKAINLLKDGNCLRCVLTFD